MTEREIFTAALKKEDRAVRDTFLDEACAGDAALRERVVSLLRHHQQLDSFMDVSSPGAARTVDMPEALLATERPGTMIGQYRLLQQIGEGGMGVVYMAEQSAPVRRRVALKIIKPGMDTREVIARFEAERQALALMEHPNIARVFDAGATEAGRPFFVMELVPAIPITDYCDQNKLPVYERLELFVTVCHAVQHAHQKGIIHRDIKPSNVLVTLHDGRPIPKVIDFGVAKAIGQRLTEKTLFTQFAQVVGTPLYMSPEQAELTGVDVDTRGDIYSLGVLLYELLTGTTPFEWGRMKQAALDEIRRMIREEDPPSPSMRLSRSAGETQSSVAAQRKVDSRGLSRLVRGDLDWIVMKALEKDRNRRYETANGFAADIRRYLSDEPVEASPPSSGYRFRKFARRNRVGLSTASLVLAALIVGTVVSTWQAIRATRAEGLADERLETASANYQTAEAQRKRAEASEQDAKTKEGLAQDARSAAVENLKDAIAAVDQMLTRVADERLANMPQMEAVRRELLQDALKFYQRFLERKNDDRAIRRETAGAQLRLARIHRSLGQYALAEIDYGKTFAMFLELAAQGPLDPESRRELSLAHVEISTCCFELGKLEEHKAHTQQAVDIAEALTTEFPQDPSIRDQLALANFYLAGLIAPTRPLDAEKILRRNLTLTKYPGHLAEYHRCLGTLLASQGRPAEAEQAIRQGLAVCEQTAKEQPSAIWARDKLGTALHELARFVAGQGRFQEAEAISGRAITVLENLAIDYPAGPVYRTTLAWAHQERAGILTKLNRSADAETAYRRVLDLFAKLAADFPAVHRFPQTALELSVKLGQTLAAPGRTRDALDVYRVAVKFQRELTSDLPARPNDWDGLVRTQLEFGRLLKGCGKAEEAEAIYREVLAIHEKLQSRFSNEPKFRRELARSHINTAQVLLSAGLHHEADKLYGWGFGLFHELISESPEQVEYRAELARMELYSWGHPLQTAGRLDEAEKALRLGQQLAGELAALHPETGDYRLQMAHSHHGLGNILWDKGRRQDSEREYREALSLLEKLAIDFPSTADYRLWLAKCNAQKGSILARSERPREAAEASRLAIDGFEKLAAESPSNDDCRLQLGYALWQQADLSSAAGRHDEAERTVCRAADVLEKLAADFPRNPVYSVEHGVCYWKLGWLLNIACRFQDAEEPFRRASVLYKQLVADYPQRQDHVLRLGHSYKYLAEALGRQGKSTEAVAQWENAAAAYTSAIELKPDHAEAWSERAFVHFSQQQWEKAVADFTKAIGLAPQEHTNWWHRGHCYLRLEQWEKAAVDFGKVVDQRPDGTHGWFLRGVALDQLNRTDEAVACYRKAATLDPKMAVARGKLGAILKRQGKLAEALKEYTTALALDPADPGIWDARGMVYVAQNQPEKAVSDFTKSIAINSKAVPVWQNRGNSHISLAHWKDALADLCKSVELEPDNGVALNNLAWLLANCPEREFRDAGRAVGLAKRAVELSPEAGYLQNTLGVALFRDGQERAAIEALQKSIDLRKGGDAFDYWFLAMSHWRLGNKDEGRAWYARGVAWVLQHRAILDQDKRGDEDLKRFRAEADKTFQVGQPERLTH